MEPHGYSHLIVSSDITGSIPADRMIVTYRKKENKEHCLRRPRNAQEKRARGAEADGQLVGLGFDVAAFTPVPYQRHRL